jgi:signal transduction histidine kinase
MKWPLERIIVAAIGPVLAILIVMGVVSFESTQNLLQTVDWVSHSHQTLEALEDLQFQLNDAQRVQRGYIITGARSYLERYQSAIASIDTDLEDVNNLIYETPSQAQRFAVIKTQSALFLKKLQEVIDLRKQNKPGAAVAGVREGEARELLDNVYKIIAEMQHTEKELLVQRNEAAKTIAKRTVYIIVTGSLLAFLIVSASSIVIYRDVVERKRTKRQLEQLNSQLQRKNRELQSIISVASHDLRSPLVNIKGFSKEIQKNTDNVQAAFKDLALPTETKKKISTALEKHIPESLDFIQNSAAMMDQLLQGLLQVARAGLAELTLSTLDMNDVLAAIAKNLEFKIKDASVELSIEPLPQCAGDPTQITHIFLNLIDNAIKYRDSSRPAKIRVSGLVKHEQAVYCVEDTGLGIPAGQQEKIFEIFYRLGTDDNKGEGIGLAIVKRMVERHNGKIWVESEQGKGSKFFVALPRSLPNSYGT